MTPLQTGFKRGEIRLANLNPSRGTETGKTRPCLIVQCDELNEAEQYSTVILPLTSQLVADGAPLRFHISKRDKLSTDSDIMVDQIRTIDNRHFTGSPLTVLSVAELTSIEEYLKIILGISDH